jgi:hypothetical protein
MDLVPEHFNLRRKKEGRKEGRKKERKNKESYTILTLYQIWLW